jgi:hypothetical protein
MENSLAAPPGRGTSNPPEGGRADCPLSQASGEFAAMGSDGQFPGVCQALPDGIG